MYFTVDEEQILFAILVNQKLFALALKIDLKKRHQWKRHTNITLNIPIELTLKTTNIKVAKVRYHECPRNFIHG